MSAGPSIKFCNLWGTRSRSLAATALLALSSCATTNNTQLAMPRRPLPSTKPAALMVQVVDDADQPGIAAALQTQLLAQLRAGGGNVTALPQGASPAGISRNAILLRCDIKKADAGNEELRLAVGFGAGQATLQVETQLIDLRGGQDVTLMSFATRSTTGALPGPALGLAGALNAGQLIGVIAGAGGLAAGAAQGMGREVDQSGAKIAMQTKAFFEQNGWPALTGEDASELGQARL